jgi:medium-chain acyl-[acyl-carrier-protein] hydrolase
LEALRRLGGTPAEILDHAEFMELMLPVLRADFAVAETYVYEPREPLGLSISAFGGLEDRVTSLEDLAAWQAQTCGPFRLRMVPGNHFFLDTARAMLLQSISEDLNDLLGQGDRLS